VSIGFDKVKEAAAASLDATHEAKGVFQVGGGPELHASLLRGNRLHSIGLGHVDVNQNVSVVAFLKNA
jgi:hypothetical protein